MNKEELRQIEEMFRFNVETLSRNVKQLANDMNVVLGAIGKIVKETEQEEEKEEEK